MHLARSPLSRRVDEVNTLRGLPPLLILTDRIAEVLKERHCVGMQALQRRRRGRSCTTIITLNTQDVINRRTNGKRTII